MTEAQRAFVELDKKKDEYKKFMEDYTAAVEQLVSEMGIGGHFQDAEGTIYQVHDCKGKFVYFDKHEVKRTKRETDLRAGTLSKVKAEALGY